MRLFLLIFFVALAGAQIVGKQEERLTDTVIPSTLRFNSTVQHVVNSVNTGRIETFMTTFTAFYNRFFKHGSGSGDGLRSQRWLFDVVQQSLAEVSYPGENDVYEVNHGFTQKSIVVKLMGSDPVLKNEVVIVGAHLDSVSNQQTVTEYGRAPGADDNASGCAAVLETLRDLLSSGVVLKRTVEFHFYAVAEVGFRGSQAIALDYKARNVNVVAMLNLDSIGFQADDINDIGVHTDNGHPEVIRFVHMLTGGYLSYGSKETYCGTGCSDHVSWESAGYPTVWVSGYTPNFRTHTPYDTIETIK